MWFPEPSVNSHNVSDVREMTFQSISGARNIFVFFKGKQIRKKFHQRQCCLM